MAPGTGLGRKFWSFLAPGDLSRHAGHPRPWEEPGHPYFVTNPADNPDGYGGYRLRFTIDGHGLPVRTGSRDRAYDPLLLSRFALKLLQVAAEEGDPRARERARSVLPFLVRSGEATGAWGPGPTPDAMATDRPSALVQGFAISAILRLADGSPSPRARRVLDRALDWYETPVRTGGILSTLGGGPFLEEIPRVPPAHILNGCLYGLFGLYDMADAFADGRARDLSHRVERTLEENIRRFTAPGGWSFYALDVFGHRPLASVHYHVAHVFLVRVVAGRTGSTALARAWATWARSLGRLPRRLLFGIGKTAQIALMRGVRRLPLRSG